MFLRVVRGRVEDDGAARDELERWRAEGAPAGPGLLGSTIGISTRGMFVGLFMFTTGLAARRADEWAGQVAGCRRMERILVDPVVVDHPYVRVFGEGGSPPPGSSPAPGSSLRSSPWSAPQAWSSRPAGPAGRRAPAEADISPVAALGGARFVLVAQGRTVDLRGLWALRGRLAERLPEGRPDLLGIVSGGRSGGAFVEAIYHDSEELAHAGDRGEPDPEVAEILDDTRMLISDVASHALRRPWLYTPGLAPLAAPGRRPPAPALARPAHL